MNIIFSRNFAESFFTPERFQHALTYFSSFFCLNFVEHYKGTDDDEGSVGVALKFFEFTNGIVNAEFYVVLVMRNDLKYDKIIKRSEIV